MDSRKICILGDFAVGKTSLVRRFVSNQFSDKYLTTIGVKIDTKEVRLDDGRGLKLAIWDVAGTDAPTELFLRYTRGAVGLLLVADAARAETLECCVALRDVLAAQVGPLPYVLLVNKSDLNEQREVVAADARGLLQDALDWLDTSALTGDKVEVAFRRLVVGLLDGRRDGSVNAGRAGCWAEYRCGWPGPSRRGWLMLLPLSIRRHLRQMLVERAKPCLLCLATDCRVLDVVGDPVRYGLGGLHAGDDARVALPLLHGIALDSHEEWPLVELSNGVYADVLIEPVASGGVHLLLTDASREHAERQAAQQHANEAQLLNRELRQTLDQLESARAELELKNRQLAELNQIKTRFIAGLSHELRTPLTAILGHAELLRERVDNQTEAVTESLRAIASGGAHLLSLVNNVLDQASIETGQLALNPAPCDLGLLLAEVAAMLRPMADRRGLEFRFQRQAGLPAWVETDAMRLRQVIINLATNAIKYTEVGSVDLQADWRDGRFRLRVLDTGPGIPPSQCERMLLPFQRGERTGGQSGVGLGLAISVQILRLLGGELRVEQRPGGGMVFGFEIPMAVVGAGPDTRPARADASKVRPHAPAPKDLPLLLVDDARDIRTLYRHLLAGCGYPVEEAADGPSARQLCRRAATGHRDCRSAPRRRGWRRAGEATARCRVSGADHRLVRVIDARRP
jgi:small GTP-binding protein